MPETTHRIFNNDARDLSHLSDNSVELVVTSPPYPMIEMWDEGFSSMNTKIGEAIEDGDGKKAHQLMHNELNKVWDELERVVSPGGIVCINIGDATRKIGGIFQEFSNTAPIINSFLERGFHCLPKVLWRKPTNSAAKFMGSGTMPPNAYVTLEHESILIFRNGERRTDFDNKNRYESTYFWEERNDWFTDVWTGITGIAQNLSDDAPRDRSAAYPFEIPYRLICMYSVYGDTVLDPFWGTGTTTSAAIVAGRNSVGYELEKQFINAFTPTEDSESLAETILSNRFENHTEFVSEHGENEFKYQSDVYGIPVKTKQEKTLTFYKPTGVTKTEKDKKHTVYEVVYTQYTP